MESSKAFGLKLGTVSYAIVNLLIIFVASYIIWFIFAASFGVFKLYPQPFLAYLFWYIMVLVFLGFNLQMWGFTHLPQPKLGLTATVVTIIFTFVIVAILNFGWGWMDPTFAPPGGYLASGLIVLIGFTTWTILATCLDHWPWQDEGMKQPALGAAELLAGFFLTVVCYLALIYPNLASWPKPVKVLMSLFTAIGWWYATIVAFLTFHLLFGNWPFTSCKTRAGRALSAFFSQIFFATVIYFVFLWCLKAFLIPPEAQEKLGPAINMWVAHLGVCVVFWQLAWALLAGNAPTGLGAGANRIVRVVIVYGLGFITFIIYTRGFDMTLLGVPAIVPGWGGDPLAWVDLLNLVLLTWIVYFGTYGIVKKA